jgi:hypothetical protein
MIIAVRPLVFAWPSTLQQILPDPPTPFFSS